MSAFAGKMQIILPDRQAGVAFAEEQSIYQYLDGLSNQQRSFIPAQRPQPVFLLASSACLSGRQAIKKDLGYRVYIICKMIVLLDTI